MRTTLKKVWPIDEGNIIFDDNFIVDSSDRMPEGFSYVQNKAEEGYVNLKFVDFFDFLPKEGIDLFFKELKRCERKNQVSPFGIYRTKDDDYQISSNYGMFADFSASSNIRTIKLCQNRYLGNDAKHLIVTIYNLSPSFAAVRYRFQIENAFNEHYNAICKKTFAPRLGIDRQSNTPWYKPHRFSRPEFTGNDERRKSINSLINRLKWNAFQELKSYFTLYFERQELFPPVFLQFYTNIRPSQEINNRGFWHSIMGTYTIDYAPKYNSCICWDSERYQGRINRGINLTAYCGGNYSKDDFYPSIAQGHLSDIYAIYLVAASMRNMAVLDIVQANREINRAMRKKKVGAILRARIKVEQTLYYSSRFINEFSGNTLMFEDIGAFSLEKTKTSESVLRFNRLINSISESKAHIEGLYNILNAASEFSMSKSNNTTQFISLLLAIGTLIIAAVTLIATIDHTFLLSLTESIKDFLFSLFAHMK